MLAALLVLAQAASLAALPIPEPVPSAEAAVAEGDRHFARRAEGAKGAVADPSEIQAALQLYRRALTLDPGSLPAAIGVLRALFFRGGFCGESDAAQKASFEEAKRTADEALKRLDAGARGQGSRLDKLRRVPGAAALCLWSAVAWGQWSLDHKLAAAWQGAAARIRDLAEIAVAIDPGYEEGSPYLVLGRLHAESPKIVFLTSWISRKKALENLRRAYRIAPANTVTEYFLGDAILDFEPSSREEGLRLLRACGSQQPRLEYLVEDRHYSEQARERLADPGVRP